MYSDELSRLLNQAFAALGAEWFALTPYRRAAAVVRWLKANDRAVTVTAEQLAVAMNGIHPTGVTLVDQYVIFALVIDAANQLKK
jgi:hypothetical protein